MATISSSFVGRVDHSDDDANISLIYAFLPPVVRRSMPKVRSLRRSFNSYRSFGGHSRSSSIDSTDSGRTTPPPAYHENPAPLTSILSDDEILAVDGSGSVSGSGKRASFLRNEESGIQWKYASQGLNLLTLSAQESSLPTSDSSFSRQLYIDAATYLLRGLPEELTEEELISLKASTPQTMTQTQIPVGQLVPREEEVQDVQRPPQDYNPTVLHRMVSTVVLQLFMLFSLLWPYIQVFVRSAYDYERQHHISERFATSTWSTANAIGKRTVSTVNLVCTWNDGQVGETLESVVTWWIQGVAGGLCEGVGEGMEALGVKPKQAPRRRAVSGRRQTRA